ncbi:hypothetical protein [Xanthomonas theicola]|uniref:hypothetical protein n=1 Tax=Xanthomonas theicola TaxID=56464 RepID=UPI001FE25F18|nr:hypothetical protein [Xanthomonas theicola]
MTSAIACGDRLVPGLTTVPIEIWPMPLAQRRDPFLRATNLRHRRSRAADQLLSVPGRLHPTRVRVEQPAPSRSSISASSLEAAGWVMLAASAARSTERRSCSCASSRCRVFRREALNQGLAEAVMGGQAPGRQMRVHHPNSILGKISFAEQISRAQTIDQSRLRPRRRPTATPALWRRRRVVPAQMRRTIRQRNGR